MKEARRMWGKRERRKKRKYGWSETKSKST